MRRWILVTAAGLGLVVAHEARAGQVEICAEHLDASDWVDLFSNGQIRVPAYTVFTFGGPVFNGLQDPKDEAHWSADKNSWVGISPAEEKRRDDLISQDLQTGPLDRVAFIILKSATLTQGHPCTTAMAAAAISPDWGWSQEEIPKDATVFYQAYGTLGTEQLDTSFSADSDQFQFAAARGEINASVINPIEHTYIIPTSP